MNIFTTTLRLNLADEDDKRAYEYLKRMDKKKYRSYSKAIVSAVNDYFERQEHLAADHYLETREKEDAFLKRIAETIENSLRSVSVNIAPVASTPEESADSEELSAALDFADSF